MSKLDGRIAGNSKMAVLARLAGEIAYTQARLCLRGDDRTQKFLTMAASNVEFAMKNVEAENE